MKGFDFINACAIKSEQFNKTDVIIVKLLAASLFFSYFVSFAAVAAVFVMLLCSKRMRSMAFCKPFALASLIIFAFGGTVSAVYKNWLGVVGIIGIVAVMAVGQYMSAALDRKGFLSVIDTICALAPFAALTTVAEFIITNIGAPIFVFRSGRWLYFHENYLGTFAAIIATMCIYRFFTNPAHRLRYIIFGICSIICIILSGSMFAYIELAVAAIVMLIFCRKWKSLAILIVCLSIAGAAVIILPELIPRLGEADSTLYNRTLVWKSSFEMFKQTPLFGRGVLAYYHIDQTVGTLYPTTHAHNILLDSLLNFGIIGTVLLIGYFIIAWKKLARAVKLHVKTFDGGIIVGVLAGTLVHSLIDITFLWVQPGVILLIALSAGGFMSKKN